MGPLSKLGCLLFCNILHSSLLNNVESLFIESRCGSRIRRGRTLRVSMQKSNADLVIESFEKSWIENKIVAKSVKHTAFDWICGSLRGLQATTSQYKQGSTVLQVPTDAVLSAQDSGMQGCPPGNRQADLFPKTYISCSFQQNAPFFIICNRLLFKLNFSFYLLLNRFRRSLERPERDQPCFFTPHERMALRQHKKGQ